MKELSELEPGISLNLFLSHWPPPRAVLVIKHSVRVTLSSILIFTPEVRVLPRLFLVFVDMHGFHIIVFSLREFHFVI